MSFEPVWMARWFVLHHFSWQGDTRSMRHLGRWLLLLAVTVNVMGLIGCDSTPESGMPSKDQIKAEDPANIDRLKKATGNVPTKKQ